MAGILDDMMAYLPQGILSGSTTNYGPEAGDLSAIVPPIKVDPYAELDKKQKEEAAKKAARGIFETGGTPDPNIGISGQQPMTAAPFGALAPMVATPSAGWTHSSSGADVPLSPAPQPAPLAASPAAAPMAGTGGSAASETPAVATAPSPGVPLPRLRPAAAPSTVDDTTLPASVANAQAQGPAPAVPETSLMGRIGKGVKDFGDNVGNHTSLLLGMASGLTGAPSWGTGLSRGFAGAAAGQQVDQKQALDNTGKTALLKAFQEAKVPSSLAIAALNDPALRQKVFDNYLSDRKAELKSIDLPNGTKMSVLHNPYTNTVTDLQGKPIDLNNTQGGAIDPNLTGEAARAAAEQSDPSLLRQAQNYVTGAEMLPSGRALTNPRLKAAVDLARQLDPELTDNVSQARTAYMKDVGNTKNGVGFQVKGFQQGVEHTYALAKAIEQYAPSDGFGSADLAHAVNAIKQRFGASSGLARTIQTEGQAAAGEMGKLYSGNSGGGVHERADTAARFKPERSSATELAGSLEATADLMEGGLRSIEQNRDRVMGEHGSKLPQVQFRNPETEQKIAEIRSIAKRLRGEEGPAAGPPAAASAPSTGKTSTGVSWSVQ